MKPGRLTAEEFEVLKTHTTIGGKILSGGRFALLKMAEEIALTHHERWDGTGYPHGLREATTPLAGRIVRTPRCYIVPRPDGRVVIGATTEEKGFDTSVDAGAVHRLLEAAWEVLPDVWELEYHQLLSR